jgi:hypothetical protein
MTSAVSLSANGGQLIKFETTVNPIGVTPNTSNSDILGGFIRATTDTNPNINTGNFVISFWGYCPQGTVFDSRPNDPDGGVLSILHTVVLTGNGNSIEWSSYPPSALYNPGSGLANITLRTNNFGYHHYLICVDTSQSTNALRYRMFRDGVEHSLITATTNNFQLPLGNSYNFMMSTTNTGPVGGYGEIGDWFPGSGTFGPSGLTQFFLDYGGSYPIGDASFRNKFYTFKNLGVDGTLTGLDEPKLYFRLDDKDDLDNGGSLGGSGVWKKYTRTGTFPNFTYTLNDFTATTVNNSIGKIENIADGFDLTSEGQSIQLVTANLNSASSMNVAAKKAVTLNSNISSTASISTAALRTKQLAASILSQGFAVTAAAKVADFFVPMVSSTALTADGNTNTQINVNITSATNMLVSARANRVFNADIASDCELLSDSAVVLTTDVDLNSNFTVAVQVRKTVSPQAQLTSATNLLATPVLGNQLNATLTSAFITSAVGLRTARVAPSLISRATLAARGDRVVRFGANIQSQGFILVAGQVLQLDPELTYVIEQETRTFVITGEDREYIIEEESRVYIVSEETRNYLVEQNTAVNII